MRAPASASEKRSSLIQAATKLLHQQGYERTSLAQVATEARVPLGNVYYYFRTKDALAEAVIAAHEAGLRAQFASWEAAHADIRSRLQCLIRAPLDAADSIIQFGCPHGSLCQELEKLGARTSLARSGARLLSVYIDWAEGQFRAHGFARREASALATELVAAVQGTMLVAHTLRSRELLQNQLHRLERWLDESLSPSPRIRQ